MFYNIDAENSVLSNLLTDEKAIIHVVDRLTPDMLYNSANKIVYKAIIDLFQTNKIIDIITVSDYLQSKNNLKKVGGRAYINDLALYAITSALIDNHIEIIEKNYTLRKIERLSEELKEVIQEGDKQKAIDFLHHSLQEIIIKTEKSKTESLCDVAFQVYNTLEIRYENKEKDEAVINGVLTGFYDIDERINCLEKGELIYLAARPSMGKTSFALNIAYNAAKTNNVVAFYSLEMSKTKLCERLISSGVEINLSRIKKGDFTDSDWIKISGFLKDSDNIRLFINDSPAMTVAKIKAKTKELLYQQGRVDLIIIDYLGLIERPKSNKSTNDIVGDISRELKYLAAEFQSPVLCLCQLSRKCEERHNKRPMLSDLRDSGSLEQDADKVIFIYRDEVYNADSKDKGKAEIITAKYRDGEVGTDLLLFDATKTAFKNPCKSITAQSRPETNNKSKSKWGTSQ